MSYIFPSDGSKGIRARATLLPRAGRQAPGEYDRRRRENSMHARLLVPLVLLAAASPALAAEKRDLVHHELEVKLEPAEHGIKVTADRPGVGQNLQDHLEL